MEKAIILTGSIRDDILEITPLLDAGQLQAALGAVRGEVHLSPKIAEYIYRLASATRSHSMILAGVSTRGAIGVADAARARAFLAGRDHVRNNFV